jgi:enoyl-CoA hydratase/carnithine racemase
MTDPLITYELDGSVALIGLNRADKRNAINDAMIVEMRAAINRANEEAACGIIYGHGVNFSAGLDLAELMEKVQSGAAVKRRHTRHSWHEVFDLMDRGPIPYIAALHGPVMGGGLELACAAHIRVADATTIFGLPEARRGIFVGGGGTVRIQRVLSNHVMVDMMLTGRLLNCEEGLRDGLCRYVTPAGGALAKARELAQKIAENPELSNWKIINVLQRVKDLSHDDGLFMEYLASNMARPQGSENRLKDFVEKRAEHLLHPGKTS